MQIPNKLRHSRNVQTISEITCENEDEFQFYVWIRKLKSIRTRKNTLFFHIQVKLNMNSSMAQTLKGIGFDFF